MEISDIDSRYLEEVINPKGFDEEETSDSQLTLSLSEDTRDYYMDPHSGHIYKLAT